MARSQTLEFFYDCSSPWTYLAFHRIEDLAEEGNARLVWRPILVGGVFNTINPSVYEARARPVKAKAEYRHKDLQDWARFYDLRIGEPPVFPVNSVKAMRGALVAAESGLISEYSRAVFEAYWGRLLDISQDDVLESIVREVGLDWDSLVAKIRLPETKQKLRDNTDELIARGGFGSPTLFVNGGDMYFGNDRLPLVAHALSG